ncbi:unnamed protein product, partial [Prorocentrum cordatum]
GPVVAVAGSQRQHAAGDRVARADGRTYRPPRRGRLRRKMGVSAEQLPLASVLEGGTWQAGRELAKAKRADGSPPVSIRTAPSSEEGLRGAFSSPYSSSFSLCRPCHPPSVGRWVRVRISLASGGAKFQSSLDSSCSAARLPLAGRPEVRGACKPRPMGASLFERGERGCEDFGPAPAAF